MPAAVRVAVHIPSYGDGYQRALVSALTAEGVSASLLYERTLFGVSVFFLQVVRRRADVLHIHWQHPFLLGATRGRTLAKATWFLLQVALLRLLGVRVVWTVHNLVSHEKRFEALERFACNLLARLVDTVIVHCPSAVRSVRSAYGLPDGFTAEVVPMGHFVQLDSHPLTRDSARERLHLPRNARIFLCLGLIRSYKGVEELCDVFAELGDESTLLVVAGKPQDQAVRSAILAKCAGNPYVRTFFEYVTDDDLPVFFRASDVVVLPYRDILTSGGLVTAMSFSKAVVAPQLGCIQDLVAPTTGITYDPAEADGLRQALLRAKRLSLEECTQMGQAARSVILRTTWVTAARRLQQLYGAGPATTGVAKNLS